MANNKKNEAKQAAFLAAFSECGNISRAAKIAGIERRSHYSWIKDPIYAERFADAENQAVDTLEAEARRRAVEGIDEPVYYKGEVCGTVRKYSDTLLIFLLKGARPDKYRDNVRQEITGKDGGPLRLSIEDMLEDIE